MEQKWESIGHAAIVPERLSLSKGCLASSSRFQSFFKLSQKSTLLLQFPHFLLVFLFFFLSLNIYLQLFFFFFFALFVPFGRQNNSPMPYFPFTSSLIWPPKKRSFLGWLEEKKSLSDGIYTYASVGFEVPEK